MPPTFSDNSACTTGHIEWCIQIAKSKILSKWLMEKQLCRELSTNPARIGALPKKTTRISAEKDVSSSGETPFSL